MQNNRLSRIPCLQTTQSTFSSCNYYYHKLFLISSSSSLLLSSIIIINQLNTLIVVAKFLLRFLYIQTVNKGVTISNFKKLFTHSPVMTVFKIRDIHSYINANVVCTTDLSLII